MPFDSGAKVLLERIEARLKAKDSLLVDLRRHIHQAPELSGNELATTAYISQQLDAGNIPHRIVADGRGIITDLLPAPGHPAIALRADIDALPIQEETNVSFRSHYPGIMHACGHDAHAAMLLITALALARERELPFAWRALFQPSEEQGHGALQLVREGALENVDGVLALHVDPNREVGKIGVTPGPRTAFCRDFVIEVLGRGGHAARPHTTIDPIATAAHLVTLIYQALPRSRDSRDPLVVTIGSFQGGHTSNVIPDVATLKGTIRALSREVALEASARVQQLAEATAKAFSAEVRVSFKNLLNGMVNDEQISRACAEAGRELLGAENVVCNDPPSLGGEDFADYLETVPGCMMALGVAFPDRGKTPLHTATFDLNEAGLAIGPRLLVRSLFGWPRCSPPLMREPQTKGAL